MKVYVVRHGQSEGNRLRKHCGWSDTPLSTLGREQARATGEALEGIAFDRVYSSDLPRARETARLALPQSEPLLNEKLREVGVGTLSNRFMRDCQDEYGELYLNSVKEQDFSPFGGETQADIRSRVVSFINELEQLEGVNTVAVFGHEGTVHQMLNYTLGYDILLEHLHISNASVSVFEYTEGVWRLKMLNYSKYYGI